MMWSGQLAYLRFYLIMMDDRVCVAFMEMHKSKNCVELDGHNSAEQPPNVFEIASEIFNDPNKDFATFKYPTLHNDFCDHIYLWGKGCSKGESPEIKG
jgi:hypothetical protein